jgi:hypothetical protein
MDGFLLRRGKFPHALLPKSWPEGGSCLRTNRYIDQTSSESVGNEEKEMEETKRQRDRERRRGCVCP